MIIFVSKTKSPPSHQAAIPSSSAVAAALPGGPAAPEPPALLPQSTGGCLPRSLVGLRSHY